MAPATYFVQECPTCGRTLEVRVEYLGKRVACRHCQGSFLAVDSTTQPAGEPSVSLLARAEQLLAKSASRPRVIAPLSFTSTSPISVAS